MDNELEDRLKSIEGKLDQLAKQSPPKLYFGREYKSKRTIWSMPLIHIAQGIDPETGRPRVAGFIAIGNVAIGVLALGGVAFGIIAIGGVSVGLFTLGGLAIGVILGAGGLAVGLVAFGGMAIGYYAIGGGAFGVHVLGGNAQDADFLNMLQSRFGMKWPPK